MWLNLNLNLLYIKKPIDYTALNINRCPEVSNIERFLAAGAANLTRCEGRKRFQKKLEQLWHLLLIIIHV